MADKKMIKQRYMSVKDIKNEQQCAYSTAHNLYHKILDYLDKKKHQKLLVREYLEYMGLKPEDIGIEPN